MDDNYLKAIIGYSLGLLSTLPAMFLLFIYELDSGVTGNTLSMNLGLLGVIPSPFLLFIMMFGFVIAVISMIKYTIIE